MIDEKAITDYLQEQLTQCQRTLKITKDECDHLRDHNEELRAALQTIDLAWPPLNMTPQCEQYLRILHRHKGVVTKETLYTVMYSGLLGADAPDLRIIDVQVCKLRKKLPPDSIETVWGRGWMLTNVGRKWLEDEIAAYKRRLGIPPNVATA